MGYAEIYDDYIVENDVRNLMGIRATLSMVRRGRPTLVLVRRLIHGRAIADRLSNLLGFGVPFLSGEDDGLVRKNALDDIRDERLGCVVASTIADEGLDVKPLSGLVLLGAGKSSTRALQRIGRVLRPWRGKQNAEVVDFNDQALHLVVNLDLW
jgi:superfamily II DNA or RNA helicase